MNGLQPQDHRFISARRKQADALVALMNEAPKLDGETFWHSIALHLLEAGYAKQAPEPARQTTEPIPHVMWRGEAA